MSNPFVSRQEPKGWVVSLSLVAMVVGTMGSMVYFKSLSGGRMDRPSAGAREGTAGISEENVEKLREEVSRLRDENQKLSDTLAEGQDASKDINENLKKVSIFAGLTEIHGPGIIITLSDSKKSAEELLDYSAGIIHDLDVLKTVNELWNAGAEAIAINGKRVGPNSNYRCVGTTIHVDEQKIASPIAIQAVGDPSVLYGALSLPGGALSEIKDVDPQMVKIENAKELLLPPWKGTTEFEFAKQPDPKKEEDDKE
ncbi:MAG: DUF881 domain-containing protein [Armatimonadetes bacterium]|nr:DUF881 domain-containing protein [Armatimonadota bacterium]